MAGGRARREGEPFKNPALAKTLRLLAERGRDAYYRGPIAEALVRYSKAQGGLFSLHKEHPNALAPGKRPFHTIIPAFVTKDGAPLMAFGLMGGDMQPQGHAQVIVNLFDFGMNLQEAGDAIRFHHTGSTEPTGTAMTDGGILHIEDGLPQAVLDELKQRGPVIEPESVGAHGGYQAIWRDPATGMYAGATAKREDGGALGHRTRERRDDLHAAPDAA